MENPDYKIQWIIKDPDKNPFGKTALSIDVELDVIDKWSDINQKWLEKNNTDIVFMFPEITVTSRTEDDLFIEKFINELKVPFCICYQYDHHDAARPYERGNFNVDFEVVSGLGDNALGIFLDKRKNNTPLLDVAMGADSGVVARLFDVKEPLDIDNFAQVQEDYFNNNNLFFCYYNTETSPVMINRINFSILCILKSLAEPQNKKIDILINMTKVQYYGDEYPQLKNYTISYLDMGTEQNLNDGEEQSGPKIRILNCFPMSSDTFNAFLDASDNFAGLTGDQSFSEALSKEKTILYQTVVWKNGLYNAYYNYVQRSKNDFPYTSNLVQNSKENTRYMPFAVKKGMSTGSRFEENLIPILDILNKKSELIDESRRLSEKLFTEKNLYLTLPKLVSDLLEKPLSTLLKRGNLDSFYKFANKNPVLIRLENEENILKILEYAKEDVGLFLKLTEEDNLGFIKDKSPVLSNFILENREKMKAVQAAEMEERFNKIKTLCESYKEKRSLLSKKILMIKMNIQVTEDIKLEKISFFCNLMHDLSEINDNDLNSMLLKFVDIDGMSEKTYEAFLSHAASAGQNDVVQLLSNLRKEQVILDQEKNANTIIFSSESKKENREMLKPQEEEMLQMSTKKKNK